MVGLDHGADDYLAKPVGLAEFQAGARALVRRADRLHEIRRRRLPGRSLRIEVDGPACPRRSTSSWSCVPGEFDLLRVLNRHHGEVVPRDRMMTEVWRPGWYGSPKTLDVTHRPGAAEDRRGRGHRPDRGRAVSAPMEPAPAEQLDPVVVDVDTDDPVLLPQQDRHGEADIAQPATTTVGHPAESRCARTSHGCPAGDG